jgi:hypothetical protein
MEIGKLLIVIGIICLTIGLLLTFKISIPFFGKLPGDFSFKGDNFRFYFPLTTSIILSVILSLLFYLFSGRIK